MVSGDFIVREPVPRRIMVRYTMLNGRDLPYYKVRELADRDAAATARCLASREAHARLAEHYSDRVWALEEALKRTGRKPAR